MRHFIVTLLLLVFAARAVAAEPEAPKLELNTATIAQLVKLPGIGPKRAAAIVKARTRRPFRRVRDLLRIKGIGKKSLARLRPLVTVAVKPRRAAPTRPRPPTPRR